MEIENEVKMLRKCIADLNKEVKTLQYKNFLEIGTILEFGGSVAPDGFLIANGDAVSRSTYANLFDVIGTTFGVGDGSTTFNLPDHRTRVAVGVDTGYTLNQKSGSTTATLNVANLPSHSHRILTSEGDGYLENNATPQSINNGVGTGTNTQGVFSDREGSSEEHYLSSSFIENTGSGNSFSIMQPYIAMNFIIKY